MMTARIGKHQTRTLRRYGRAGTQITADGLRSLADAMDRGVVDDVREQIKRERAERKKGEAQ